MRAFTAPKVIPGEHYQTQSPCLVLTNGFLWKTIFARLLKILCLLVFFLFLSPAISLGNNCPIRYCGVSIYDPSKGLGSGCYGAPYHYDGFTNSFTCDGHFAGMSYRNWGCNPKNEPYVMVASLGNLQGLLSSGMICQIPGEEVYYYHNDHLGTPQAMTDKNGTIVWKADYLPFGEGTVNEDPDEDGNTVTNNLRFPGQYFDHETGLHYNWHRDYHPGIGRYIESDPMGISLEGLKENNFLGNSLGCFEKKLAKTTRALNHLYVYSQNNPSNQVDPFGTLSFPFHGNFCGPGHGRLDVDKPWDPSTDGGIDKCCEIHDKCYRDKCIKDPYPNSIEKTDCDRSLCNCIRRSSPPLRYWKTKYSLLKYFQCFDNPSSIWEWRF